MDSQVELAGCRREHACAAWEVAPHKLHTWLYLQIPEGGRHPLML
jgi:hypothetical protein